MSKEDRERWAKQEAKKILDICDAVESFKKELIKELENKKVDTSRGYMILYKDILKLINQA